MYQKQDHTLKFLNKLSYSCE